MASIGHYEVAAKDVNKIKAFYGDLFSWEFNEAPSPADVYYVAQTKMGDHDGVSFGIYEKSKEGMIPMYYVGVENIDESAEKVSELGGKITFPKMPVPGMGWMIWCQDPEGNPFALWQDDKEAK